MRTDYSLLSDDELKQEIIRRYGGMDFWVDKQKLDVYWDMDDGLLAEFEKRVAIAF